MLLIECGFVLVAVFGALTFPATASHLSEPFERGLGRSLGLFVGISFRLKQNRDSTKVAQCRFCSGIQFRNTSTSS